MGEHMMTTGGQAAIGPMERPRRFLMNKAECAEFLGIRPRTLEKYMAMRRIPFMRLSQKLVRFDRDEVVAALRERR